MSKNTTHVQQADDEKISWRLSAPFFIIHILALGFLFIEGRTIDWVLCGVFYFIRMFAITAGYHRYFSHRSYKMGRISQFLMAFIGSMATQKGALWWAGHHRHHHKYSDMPEDIHSPVQKSFWWSHVGWIL